MLSPKKLLAICVLAVTFSADQNACGEVFEMRTYTTNEGKLEDLNARFRDHTIKLFEKHGIRNVGYWVPTEKEKFANTLIYIIAHKDRAAAKVSWKAFMNDPDWKAAHKASEADGPILAKRPESIYMNMADYSPQQAGEKEAGNKNNGNAQASDAVYELRTYKTADGKLPALDARFRDHTIGLFNQHGIESVAYWHPADEPESQDTLIYIVRHQSRDGAKTAWQAFSKDPNWKAVAKESQKDGKFLRERPTSIYMKPTDYSAMQ